MLLDIIKNSFAAMIKGSMIPAQKFDTSDVKFLNRTDELFVKINLYRLYK